MIVFALRHADRKADGTDDLSPAGIERAELLARMLAESGIRKAYCSDARRAQRTMAPLKDLLGEKLMIVVVLADPDHIAVHVKQIVDQIKALPDDAVAAVVGHTNTVGSIIKGLTGRTIDAIAESE